MNQNNENNQNSEFSLPPLLSGSEYKTANSNICRAANLLGQAIAILTGKRDKAAAIFGQLRDAYDGTCRAVYGTGKDTKYKSKFGIIAAVTNVIDKHLRLLSSLGERFLTYRMPKLSDYEVEARTDLAGENRSAKQQEIEIRGAAHNVLYLNPEPSSISKELRKELCKMARFVAVARTEIQRDGQTKEIDALPDPEVPTRLVKQLVSLAMGIAMAREKKDVTEDEVKLVIKVALGSIPPMRLKVLSCLTVVYPKSMTSKNVAGKIRISPSVVRRCLEEMYALSIVERSKADRECTTPWDWTVIEKYGKFLREIEI